jgi:L-lysine 6-transaminase
MAGLGKLAQQFPQLITNVRGRGLMCAFDLPSGDIRGKAIDAMEANDLLVLASGHQSIRFRPGLTLTSDEAAEGIRRMEKSLKQIG